MLAALLTAYLVFSGGGGFAGKMFGKDTQALVREVVSDPARAAVAVETLKRGNKELKAIGKQFEDIAKAFSKADEDPSAGLEELTAAMARASEQRRVTQEVCLDRVFELRQALTEEEWGKVLATLK